MVARGEQGRVWRLDTESGAFAIKGAGIIRLTPPMVSMSPIRGCARDRCGVDAATYPHVTSQISI
jgi:hypothetical protein